MSVWTVILIIAVIAAIILGVLYFVGRKMQAKQEDQRAQLDQMAQTVNMLVIDKKRMKIMEAGFPKMVTDNIPKRAKMSKVPVVKAKVGPKITPLLCDEAIFDDVPVKAEIKAVVSGIYITSIKNLRNVAPPEPEKRGLRAKLTKKVLNLCVRINFLLLYKNLKCKIPETYHLKVSGIFVVKYSFIFFPES
jgi:hypothetical protein